jgi:hypothetical protein
MQIGFILKSKVDLRRIKVEMLMMMKREPAIGKVEVDWLMNRVSGVGKVSLLMELNFGFDLHEHVRSLADLVHLTC